MIKIIILDIGVHDGYEGKRLIFDDFDDDMPADIRATCAMIDAADGAHIIGRGYRRADTNGDIVYTMY